MLSSAYYERVDSSRVLIANACANWARVSGLFLHIKIAVATLHRRLWAWYTGADDRACKKTKKSHYRSYTIYVCTQYIRTRSNRNQKIIGIRHTGIRSSTSMTSSCGNPCLNLACFRCNMVKVIEHSRRLSMWTLHLYLSSGYNSLPIDPKHLHTVTSLKPHTEHKQRTGAHLTHVNTHTDNKQWSLQVAGTTARVCISSCWFS